MLADLLVDHRRLLLSPWITDGWWSPPDRARSPVVVAVMERFLDDLVRTLLGEDALAAYSTERDPHERAPSAFDVVCEYGALLEGIVDLAAALDRPITSEEHRVLLAAMSSGAAAAILRYRPTRRRRPASVRPAP